MAAAIDKADAGAADGAIDTAAAPTAEAAPAKRKWWQRKPKADAPVTSVAELEAQAAAATGPAPTAVTTAPLSTPEPAAAAPAKGGQSLIQLGIFSVEENAERAAATVTKAGSTATVRKETSNGKPYWSVVAGPAGSAAERDALMKKVKDLGFTDAYFVSR